MFSFSNPEAMFGQYQQWLQQMQHMQQQGANAFSQNPWSQNPWSQNSTGQNPWSQNPWSQNSAGQNPWSQGNPFTAWQQMPGNSLNMFNQMVEQLRQFANPGGQGGMWGDMFSGFGSTNHNAPNLPWSFGGNFRDTSPFGTNIFGLAGKFQRMQQLALQIYKLLGEDDLDKKRSEMAELCRQLSSVLLEEINNFAGNYLTVQFINQMRGALDWQRRLLDEQRVQASMTPYNTDFAVFSHTCHLWQEVCETSLGMIDLYQQFIEQTGDNFVTNIDESKMKIHSPEEVMDLFVQAFESEFVKFLRSENFSQTYGELANSIIAVRADQQQYIDKVVEAFGLPSKREMDTSHKRVHRHSKEIRQLQQHLANQDANAAAAASVRQETEARLSSFADRLATNQTIANTQGKQLLGLARAMEEQSKTDHSASVRQETAASLSTFADRLATLQAMVDTQGQQLLGLAKSVEALTKAAAASQPAASPSQPETTTRPTPPASSHASPVDRPPNTAIHTGRDPGSLPDPLQAANRPKVTSKKSTTGSKVTSKKSTTGSKVTSKKSTTGSKKTPSAQGAAKPVKPPTSKTGGKNK